VLGSRLHQSDHITWTMHLCVSVCSGLTFESLVLERSFCMRLIFRIFRSTSYIKVTSQDHRSKIALNFITPPLLWQSWGSIAAAAVTASPFQSFSVRRCQPADTWSAAGERMQTSYFQSADRHPVYVSCWAVFLLSLKGDFVRNVICNTVEFSIESKMSGIQNKLGERRYLATLLYCYDS